MTEDNDSQPMGLPDDIDISCPFQLQGLGVLKCRAADTSARDTTDEVNEEICASCQAGKIYRERGCQHISPKVRIARSVRNLFAKVDGIRCTLRDRPTSYEECKTCTLIESEFTRETRETVTGLLSAEKFDSSLADLEKARKALNGGDPEGCITSAISSLESTFKTVLDRQQEKYPSSQDLTHLWQALKGSLKLGDEVATPHLQQVIGSMTGALSGLGALRNALSDAHGKGEVAPEVVQSYGELALNLSCTVSTFIVRRYKETV